MKIPIGKTEHNLFSSSHSKLIQSRKGTENWTAVLGSGDRSQRMISLPIEDIYVHPNFVDYQNDIGKTQLL